MFYTWAAQNGAANSARSPVVSEWLPQYLFPTFSHTKVEIKAAINKNMNTLKN